MSTSSCLVLGIKCRHKIKLSADCGVEQSADLMGWWSSSGCCSCSPSRRRQTVRGWVHWRCVEDVERTWATCPLKHQSPMQLIEHLTASTFYKCTERVFRMMTGYQLIVQHLTELPDK